MPMDDLDFSHIVTYPRILHIYANDKNVEKVVTDFLLDVPTAFPKDIFNGITNVIKKLQNALSVLDYREITNVGGRVVNRLIDEYVDESYTKYKTEWILIQVWRGRRPYSTFEN
jgi:hypothetical protein